MKTLLRFALGFLLLGFSAAPILANAQTYGYYYQPSYSCPSITQNLSLGSRGSDVLALQQFLVAQNYPGSGSWMLTGYYGQATAAAVRIFQGQNGLAQTGAVDGQTRAAMCGNSYGYNYGYNNNGYNYYNDQYMYPYNYNNNYYNNGYPYNYNNYYNGYNYNYGYPYNYNYGYQWYNTNAVTLSSLTPQSGYPGQSVTIYGSGFAPSGNTVYFGGTTLSNISSYNGNQIVFTVPSNAISGANSVSVATANSSGVSNQLTFYVSGNNYQNGCGSVYGSYCPPSGPVSISYLSPQSGQVGTAVTVYGWGFSYDNNVVHFGNGIIAGLRSTDGRSVSFTVPASISGYGYQPIGLGSYNVSVTNASGQTSNAVPFTITSTGGSGGTVTINGITGPSSLAVNQTGTWTVNVTTPSYSQFTVSVNWGDQNYYGYAAAAPQTFYSANSATFSHAYAYTGTFTATFTVSDQWGHQTTSSVTVNVGNSGYNGSTALSYLTPQSGRVGTQIQLQGNGFTNDNVIHFGGGGTQHVPSQNGTTLYYTVPTYLSPCDVQVQGTMCAQYMQVVTPGSYPVYVTNGNGSTQTLNFSVTN